MAYTDHQIVFTNKHSATGWNSATYNVRITIRQTYTDGTLSSTLSLQNVEIQKVNNTATYAGLGMYGSVYITAGGTTTLVSLDNTNSGHRAHLTLSGGGYNSWTKTSVTLTNATVSHNSDGTKSVTVGVTGGHAISGVSYFGALAETSGGKYNMFGVPSSSKTLTLTPIKVYSTLTVDPNGGTWSGSESSQTFTQLSTTTKTIANPSRTGYTFTGWTKTGGGSLSGTTYTFGTTNGTLTAGWSINSYTITCEDRVGDSSGTLLGSSTASYNYDTSVSGASFGSDATYDAYYTGYHYIGSSSSVTVTGDTTVYRYFALNTWTVAYNANGGSSTPASQTKTYGVNLTLAAGISKASSPTTYTVTYNYNGNGKSDTTDTATKTISYPFKNWNTAQDGSGTAYSAGATYAANAGMTLYAQWNSSTATTSVVLPSATWVGRTFKGWYTAASGGTKVGDAGGSYTPTGNVTLYAQWTINTYAFTATAGTDIASVSLNGVSSASSVSETVEYGSTNMFEAVLGNNVAYNYSFDGWYNGANKVSSSLTYTVTATGALPLTAKATKAAKSYTLSLAKPNTGGSATVKRTSSPYGGATSTFLNNGATIYYGDVLEITYTENPGYEVDVHTIDGVAFTSPATITVTDDVSVVVSMKNAGVVWIWDGSSWEKYIPMIWNGSSWERYIPMVYTGSNWEIY